MTETKWLTSVDDPHTMEHFISLLVYRLTDLWVYPPEHRPPVTTSGRGLKRARRAARLAGVPGPTERKLALFMLACCRIVWHLISVPECRRLVAGGERRADGEDSMQELDAAYRAVSTERKLVRAVRAGGSQRRLQASQLLWAAEMACRAARLTHLRTWYSRSRRPGAEHIFGRLLSDDVVQLVRDALGYEAAAVGHRENPAGWNAGTDQATRAMCRLMRDVFGNPFRPVAFDPVWRTDTTVLLARHIYESRDFGAMPILADALQDAGCDNDAILTHCRGDGPHIRGCWVVDLVLGKE